MSVVVSPPLKSASSVLWPIKIISFSATTIYFLCLCVMILYNKQLYRFLTTTCRTGFLGPTLPMRTKITHNCSRRHWLIYITDTTTLGTNFFCHFPVSTRVSGAAAWGLMASAPVPRRSMLSCSPDTVCGRHE